MNVLLDPFNLPIEDSWENPQSYEDFKKIVDNYIASLNTVSIRYELSESYVQGTKKYDNTKTGMDALQYLLMKIDSFPRKLEIEIFPISNNKEHLLEMKLLIRDFKRKNSEFKLEKYFTPKINHKADSYEYAINELTLDSKEINNEKEFGLFCSSTGDMLFKTKEEAIKYLKKHFNTLLNTASLNVNKLQTVLNKLNNESL